MPLSLCHNHKYEYLGIGVLPFVIVGVYYFPTIHLFKGIVKIEKYLLFLGG